VWRRAAECQVELFRPEKESVDRVVDVGADATVQVLRRVDHTLAAAAGPPLGDGDVDGRGRTGPGSRVCRIRIRAVIRVESSLGILR
jgi:hypothetical protein